MKRELRFKPSSLEMINCGLIYDYAVFKEIRFLNIRYVKYIFSYIFDNIIQLLYFKTKNSMNYT